MIRELLRFAGLGAVLFAAAHAFAPVPAPAPGDVPAAVLARAERRFARERGRAPLASERAALRREHADDALLVAAARARGLDRSDPVVLRRVLANARALASDGAREPEPGPAPSALDAHDPVVQRRLANALRLRLLEEEGPAAATESELRALYAENAATLRGPARIRLSQQLVATHDGTTASVPLPEAIGWRTEALVARELGPEFAAAVFALPVGEWVSGVRSVHGIHRVRVEERVPGSMPPFEAVRSRLLDAWIEARDARIVQEALERLRTASGVAAGARS